MKLAVIGGMTIDDVVLADGSVHRRVPGGNALYSALGAHLWGADVEIVSFIGTDYPEHVLRGLHDRGIGIGHLRRSMGRSIRLWLLYEEDSRRQIHLQHDSPGLEPLADVALTELDALMRCAQPPDLAHVSALPVHVQRRIGQRLAEAGIPFTLDTLEAKGSVGGDLLDFVQGDEPLSPAAFLPSRDEFSSIFGSEESPAAQTWRQTTRTSALVIKDGAAGSLVFSPPPAAAVRLPALPSVVVDPTGAGDAFCGGYAAGMAQGKTAYECALMGTVGASFVVEGVGISGLLDVPPEERERRVERWQRLEGSVV